jgi:hypothetical protein
MEDDLTQYDRVITLEDIEIEVEEEMGSMSEEEKFCRTRDASPTFLQYCLSFMTMAKIDKALINEYTHRCERIDNGILNTIITVN